MTDPKPRCTEPADPRYRNSLTPAAAPLEK